MADFNEMNVVDTIEETDKKCPQCGGVMDFNPATGGLKCPYCDYEQAIEKPVKESDKPKKAAELDFASAEFTENCDWGVATKTVLCKACGAESVYDAMETAAVCPFCGSNQVMEANEKNTMAPGGVVPFSISDKDASERFKQWIRKKWFCPRLAKDSAKAKRFKGIYLPYWTFDTEGSAHYTAQYGIDHTHTNSKGETRVETNWHNTSGYYERFYNDELVLASNQHDSKMLHGIEPFDTENNKAYKPEYIAGFVAERYSLGIKDAWGDAQKSIRKKMNNEISSKIRTEHRADHVRSLNFSPQFDAVTFKYLLLPIWMSHFIYKDKVYHFMVNGQTGKVHGKIPISIPKVVLTVLGVLIALGLLYYFVLS
ncbi:MAG: hypothetical protein J1E62_11495 [Lachnospiraceae bacterium]|nr:hypothetical protein [Lachnospiraceae bacterium]